MGRLARFIRFYTEDDEGNKPEPGIWKTIKGALIHITDALASPVQALSVAIEPLQSGSGDPSPTNVRPITGWTGCNVNREKRNLLNPIIYDGGVYQPTVGSTLNLTKSATQFSTTDNETFTVTTSETWQYYTLLFPIPESGRNYYIYINYTSSGQCGRSAGFLDADKKVLSAINSTTKPSTWQGEMTSEETANASYFYMVLTNRGTASATITVTKPIITIYDDDHTYEPYSGTTYPISWQTEAGTVYGGTLTVNEDGSCDIVSNKLIIDLSTKTYDVTSYTEIVNAKFRTNIDDFNASPISGILSNCLQMNTNPSSTIGQRPLYSLTYVKGNYYPSEIKLPIDYNTSAKVKAFFADVDGNGTHGVLVLNRASPVTYHLESIAQITTLAGENNIWTDVNGEITLTYKANA